MLPPMPDIQAFRALRYDLGHVGSLSDVTAPPYDVISPDEQAALYKKTTTLHDELVTVDKKLGKLLPKQYSNAVNFEPPKTQNACHRLSLLHGATFGAWQPRVLVVTMALSVGAPQAPLSLASPPPCGLRSRGRPREVGAPEKPCGRRRAAQAGGGCWYGDQ